MKTTFLKLFFIFAVISFITFNYVINGISQQNGDNTFVIGAQTTGYNSTWDNPYDPFNWYRQMPYVDNTFKLNTLNFWAGDRTPPYDGGLYDAVSVYSSNVNGFINFINNTNNKLGIYGRQTFTKLCFAQRSTYHAEDNTLYGYNNNNTIGSYFYNDTYGVSGRKAVTGSHSAGYLVQGLIENCEQSDNWKYAGAGPVDDSLWYVKPRMRIPQDVAINDPDLPVCRVEIYSFDQSFHKFVDIYARHFVSSSGYNGEYIEEYFLPQDINLTVMGNTDSLNKGAYTEFNGETYTLENSQVDYKIYWHGYCDLWVDYVRLDDKWANNLFGTTALGDYYRSKIIDEASAINEPYIYYIDEIRYNNLSALRYVQQKIKSVNQNLTLAAIPFPAMNVGLRTRLPNSRQYLDSMTLLNPSSVPPVLFSDYYTLNTAGSNPGDNINYRAWLPPTLEPVNMPSLNYLWQNSSYTLYNNMLQTRLGDKTKNADATISIFNMSFVAGMYKSQTDADYKGVKHIPLINAHSWMFVQNSTGNIGTGSLREPTNEEIRVMVNLAVCYGAKGYQYFMYPSMTFDSPTDADNFIYRWSPDAAQYTTYAQGLVQKTESDRYEPVTGNYYAQNKAEEIGNINTKYSAISSVLMSLDWQNAYSVHSEGAGHEFITDIKSIDPEMSGVNGTCYLDGLVWEDCPDDRYWEMGFFEPAGNVKYFMMVNRRCVPTDSISDRGDVRILRIKFDANDLPNFTGWQITDLSKPRSQPVVFSKYYNGYVDLNNTNDSIGLFQPGEGKLFKLEPAFPKGGIMVADEHISGQIFTCEDTVISNGFNITIDEGSVISFTDSATIIMNGGTFTSGGLGESSQPTTYKGEGSGKWNGLRFNGTDVKIYNSKFQDIASPCVNYAVGMVDCQFADIRTNQFVLNTDTAGAVQSVYIEDPFGSPTYTGLHINYNTITMANSRGNAAESRVL